MGQGLNIADRVAARFGGSLKFRFIFQPATAILLGVRHGVQDGRNGTPSVFSELIHGSNGRKRAMLALVRRIIIPIMVAILLDEIDQYLLFGWIRLSGAVVMGVTLIAAPYILAREIARWIVSERRASRRTAVPKAYGSDVR